MAAFFRGLISLAAAGLKMRVGNPRGVRKHARRTADLFDDSALEVASDEARYMGLDLHALSRWARDVAERPPVAGDDGSSAGSAVFDFLLWPE